MNTSVGHCRVPNDVVLFYTLTVLRFGFYICTFALKVWNYFHFCSFGSIFKIIIMSIPVSIMIIKGVFRYCLFC